MPAWLRKILLIVLAGIALVAIGLGILDFALGEGYAKAKVRVRHYFALGPKEPLTNESVQSALLLRFPAGSPVLKAQAWLAAQGLGVDGHSAIWRENQTIHYRVEFYDPGSNDRLHVDLAISYNSVGNIESIEASNVQDTL